MSGLLRRALSPSNIIFGTRLGGAGVIFLVQAMIARLWGAEVLGDFLLIIAAANIAAMVLPLGFETTGTFFAAEYRAEGQGRHLRGFMLRAYGHIAGMTLLLVLIGHPLAGYVGAPGAVVQAHWPAVVAMTAATAVVYCNSALLVGLKRPFAGFFADTIFRPMLMLFALGLALLAFEDSGRFGGFVTVLAFGFAGVGLLQLAYLWRVARQLPIATPAEPAEPRRWWRFALPWAVIALATDLFFDIDLILLANLMDREALAVFGVCVRVFSLVAFGVAAIYSVAMPDLFDTGGDRSALLRRVGDANLAAAGVALALLFAVSLGGPFMLMLFGPAFSAGALPMALLCLTLLVRAFFGPSSVVLSMSDRPYDVLPAVGIGMVLLLVGNLLLVPPFGLVGAALAAVLAQAVWSAALWWTTLRRTGLDVSLLPRLAELVGTRRARDA